MNEKILVIEDDKNLRNLIVSFGRSEGFIMMEAEDGLKGIKILDSNQDMACIVLDVMMPGLDGWETIKFIRERHDVPVIFLTARNQVEDELKGFKLGANDYVGKPFKPQLLMARIKANMKKDVCADFIVEFQGLRINPVGHEVLVDEEIVDLSPKEFELLIHFINNKNIALSREQLLDGVWGMDYFGGLRTVDTHVKRLRLKLKGRSEMIRTIRGVGYKFEVVYDEF